MMSVRFSSLKLNKLVSRCFYTNKNFVKSLSSFSATENPLTTEKTKHKLDHGPGLEYFINNSSSDQTVDTSKVNIPYLRNNMLNNSIRPLKVYFDIYGCQMNVNDSEIVWSILKSEGFERTNVQTQADVILVVTCAIREGAENKVWNKLKILKSLKIKREKDKSKPPLKIGVLGCMAERLKEKLVEREKSVDVVAGPDSYRDLPRLLSLTEDNETAINVMLSVDETYADVIPVRLNPNSFSAYVSIMRGCDNMCTYCIVPFTRGRERSRPIHSIEDEVKYLSDQGVKEITLLGQNVNSYRDLSESVKNETKLAKGFRTVYKTKLGGLRFADLLDKVSNINPEIRIRFTSPHPKDFPDEVLHLIEERPNICRNLHLPAQSGSTTVLERMRRGYTRESYIELINHVKQLVPGVTISSDFICGFCGETDDEFAQTISLMKYVKYNTAFLFPYSLREKTTAHRRFTDDVPHEVKIRRLNEMVAVFRAEAAILNREQIGTKQLILVEGFSKRSNLYLAGRNEANIKVIFPAGEIPKSNILPSYLEQIKPGDYIVVQVNDANSQVLKGIPLYHSSITEFTNDTPDLLSNIASGY